jgi:2-amino-4-hydroxy-6-hydroxymethyldihydropteridine diphosphokinase
MSEKDAGRAIVAIGTNVPHRGLAGGALVDAALARLQAEGFAILAVSTHRTTPAWPDPADPPFTNAVAVLHGSHASAQDVLGALLRVEAAFGRTRGVRNAPRTLDLDLLDFEGRVIDEAGLTLPHPRLHARAFVLELLAEILPGWRHPVSGETAQAMWAALSAGGA